MGSYFHKFIGLGLFFFEFCKICVVHIFKCASTLKKKLDNIQISQVNVYGCFD